MKALFLLFTLACTALSAQVPAFIKAGEVYSFALVGQREPLVALVLKDEGAGWIKITAIRSRDEFWLNLAHVQIAVAVEQDPAVKAELERNQILNNLRMIAAAAEKYRLREGREARIADVLGTPGYAVPAPKSVAGEDYTALDLSGDGSLTVRTKEGTEVSFPRR